MTFNILVAVFVLLAVYDTAVYAMKGSEQTISLVVYRVCCENPIIAFVLGAIIGHILWPHAE